MSAHVWQCRSFSDRIAPLMTAQTANRPEWCICNLVAIGTAAAEERARTAEAEVERLNGVVERAQTFQAISKAAARAEATATRAENERLTAAVDAVRALHRRVPMYDECSHDLADDGEHYFETTDGRLVCGQPTHYACEVCLDSSEEPVESPCATIRALDGGAS